MIYSARKRRQLLHGKVLAERTQRAQCFLGLDLKALFHRWKFCAFSGLALDESVRLALAI
jgi:hypothetical protein